MIGSKANGRSFYRACVDRLQEVVRFAFVSGIGLAIDFAIFLVLIGAGASPLAANAVSGACAVTFVYFASVRRIFSYRGEFLFGLFAAYVIYQVIGVTLASLAVDYLSSRYVSPAAAKILILPVTFGANYLFMAYLTRSGGSRVPEKAAGPGT